MKHAAAAPRRPWDGVQVEGQHAGVAQMAERQSSKLDVEGSIPFARSTFIHRDRSTAGRQTLDLVI